jgi:hypothetical protein
MNVVDNVIYLSIIFPVGWNNFDVNVINEYFGVTVVNNPDLGATGYYFYTSIEVGFDKLFESVKFIIEMNETAQRKIDLLNHKLNELKNIFINEDDIDLLETLTFTYPPKKKRQYNRKSVDSELITLENAQLPTEGNYAESKVTEGISEGLSEEIKPKKTQKKKKTVVRQKLTTGTQLSNGDIVHPNGRTYPKEQWNKAVSEYVSKENNKNYGELNHKITTTKQQEKPENVFSKEELEQLLGEEI